MSRVRLFSGGDMGIVVMTLRQHYWWQCWFIVMARHNRLFNLYCRATAIIIIAAITTHIRVQTHGMSKQRIFRR